MRSVKLNHLMKIKLFEYCYFQKGWNFEDTVSMSLSCIFQLILQDFVSRGNIYFVVDVIRNGFSIILMRK